jgi:hypothetical protein
MKTSETITEIAAALVEFQGKLTIIKKDGKNPHFGNKYASLSAIIEAIQRPLTECGLAIIQLAVGVNQLETTLIHKSGEFISEVYEMKPARPDPQGQGSAITYQRRYALGAFLCLNIDEDDDAEQASEIPDKAKFKIPEKAFTQLCDKLKANPDPKDRGALLTKTRRYYLPLTDEQENIISEIVDNI